MIPGLKYHVQYAHGSAPEVFSGFFCRCEGVGPDQVLVFENRTTACTEEKRIASRCIASTVCYGERAPWLPPALPNPDPSVNGKPMEKP